MNSSVSVRILKRLVGVLALLLLAFAGLFGWQAWRSEKADQIGQMRTALELTHNAIDQYLLQVQASLSWLATGVLGAEGRIDDAARVSLELQRFHALHPEFTTVNLVALDGRVLASASPQAPQAPPDAGREPSFQRFLAGELLPGTTMALGQPLFGQVSQRWVAPLRYVVRDGQGRPVVFLVASVPVDLLASFWTNAPIVSKAALGLIRDDGFLVSRYPLPAGVALESAYGTPRVGVLATHLKQQGYPAQGYVDGVNQTGGGDAGNAYKRLAHFPVTLFVSLPTTEFRKAWWQRVQLPFLLLALLTVGGWLGYRYTLRRQNAWDSERRKAEEELRSSESEQRFLIDHILAGVVVHGADGQVLLVNAQACRLMGLTAEQMLGREVIDPVWHFVREDGSRMPVHEYPVPRVQSTRQPVADLVVGIVHSDAAPPVWVIANIYPEFGPGGTIRQIIVTFVDISPRLRVERALQQSENRYRMLFENSMDAVLQTKPDGTVLAANEAACRMFGLTEDDIVRGGREQFIDAADPRLQALLAQREQSGRASGELRMRRGDGSVFEAEVSSALYADPSGAQLASLVVRDVTERRRSEAATRAQELAEQANRAKSEFVARISHELRTPLNAILGFSEVLQLDERHPLAPAQREQLGHVQRAGDHLLLLINDLLDLARIEAGALSIQREEIDVRRAVDEAVGELAPQAAARGVAVSVQAPQRPLPPVHVDPTRLRQVILNLLSNAIKYNRHEGSVTVSLDAGASTLTIAVHDSGLGMSAEQVEALFQPFNRLGREATDVEGTGIGLVITRSLVALMGGTLVVRSQAGAGSEFTVTLPLSAPAAAAPAAAPSGAAAQAAPAAGAGVTGSVIYIDDDDVNQMLMQAFLIQRPGVRLTTVGDGPAGIALAAAELPQLMLVDMMMPGMDGLQVLQAVRAQPALQQVRCVALSANAMPDEIEAAIAAGFDGYLTKPIVLPLLLAEIDRWLSPPA